jgi:ribosomal protein S18 acetylase RimI-like enzyme
MISVERAKKEELKGVENFINYIWEDLYGSFLPKESAERIASNWLIPELLNTSVENPNFFLGIAKNELGQIIGLTSVSKIDYDTIAMWRLYVRPGYQRQGIGKRLLEEAIFYFTPVKRIQVEVEEENYKGRFFYFKQGFKDRSIKEENFDGENRRIMLMEKLFRR